MQILILLYVVVSFTEENLFLHFYLLNLKLKVRNPSQNICNLYDSINIK